MGARHGLRWLLLAIAIAALSVTRTVAGAAAPGAGKVLAAIACDDRARVFVNGELVGEVLQWDFPLRVDLSADAYPLVIAVEARNVEGQAALLGALETRAGGAEPREVPAAWRCSAAQEPSWNLPRFDDAHWRVPDQVAPYGTGVWGDAAGLDLERTSWVWLDPPAAPAEAIFCRWRIESAAAPAPEHRGASKNR